MINAETEWQRRQALRQMKGELSIKYEKWRESLVKCLAHVEADLEFSENDQLDEREFATGI